MDNKIVHAAKRKALEVALDAVMKKAKKDRTEGYVEVINVVEKLLGDAWPPEAYDRLRDALGKDGKWTSFFDDLLDYVDTDYLKGLIMSIGFEGGFTGFHATKEMGEKLGVSIPWVILFDPTSACNLHCKGCWASEYDRQCNMSFEIMDKIVTEGKELGIHAYVMTGGEPLVRKADVVKLAKKHKDCGFLIYTNGTLVDQKFCDDMRECKNIVLSVSIEGFEDATDFRRGDGVFQQVMDAMDLMHKNGLVYGTSICYTHQNHKMVTSDEFLDFLIEKGVKFSWYFHFMPVGQDTDLSFMPTPEERIYMVKRIREIRDYNTGKPIFTIDFQNDGEFVSGCIAGGKYYCHINPNGDVEPCVFIHYSSANINEMSLLDCLKQPLFREYQAAQPFDENLLKPCPMLENPEALRAMVERSGAKSTDMTEPESADHLCSKCDAYAKVWEPIADEIWSKRHEGFDPEKARKTFK